MGESSVVPDNLWKVTIAPTEQTDPDVSSRDSFEFCRTHDPQIVGIGWPVKGISSRTSKGEVLRQVAKEYGRRRSEVRIFVERMNKGDHAWVYDKHTGLYYVCKIKSDWKYSDGGDWDRHDIHHYRFADWRQVQKPLIAGAITRVRRRAAQGIDVEPALLQYSAFLYEEGVSISELENRLDLELLKTRIADWDLRQFFSTLDEDETEDIVGLYLQDRGWRLIKSSATRNHPDVECQFQRIGEDGSQTAYMQVKSGKHPQLKPEDYRHLVDERTKVFLFSTATRPYAGDQTGTDITTLEQEDIRDFAIRNIKLLPAPMNIKLGLVAGILDSSA